MGPKLLLVVWITLCGDQTDSCYQEISADRFLSEKDCQTQVQIIESLDPSLDYHAVCEMTDPR